MCTFSSRQERKGRLLHQLGKEPGTKQARRARNYSKGQSVWPAGRRARGQASSPADMPAGRQVGWQAGRQAGRQVGGQAAEM